MAAVTHRALTVAHYFLSIPDEEAGELISNLKLQKLLYYAQGYHLALHGKPLFDDKIYAWKHGPVVKSVYNHYARFESGALPREEATPPSLSADDIAYLDEIYRTYGKFSAWALREMTHREAPWLEHYKPNVLDIEIPQEALRAHFIRHVKKAKKSH